MKKLFNSKKGFIQYLWPILPAIGGLLASWWFWLILLGLAVAVGAFFWVLLPKLALIGIGIICAILLLQSGGSNAPAWIGLAVVAIVFINPGGFINLSWFQTGYGGTSVLGHTSVDNENIFHMDVLNLRSYEGAVGMYAVFVDDEFKVAEYFWISANSKYPYQVAYKKGRFLDVKLNNMLEPGEHTVKVYWDVDKSQADEDTYTVDEYWNMNLCGTNWINRGTTKVEMSKEIKNFNYKWLPCSKKYVDKSGNDRPENVLGRSKVGVGIFNYTSLDQADVERFKNAKYHEEYNITVLAKSDSGSEDNIVVIDDPVDDDNDVPDTQPAQVSTWQSIKNWIASINFGW